MRVSGWICLPCAMLCAAQEPGWFTFEDFASTPRLSMVGSAGRARNILRLTPPIPNLSGAAWYQEKQYVAGGFDTTFRFLLTGQDSSHQGADGFAFVMQTSGPRALGSIGSSGGFAAGDAIANPSGEGIPLSLAVFFDTYRNLQAGDPSDNFVVIAANGKRRDMQWPPRWIGVRDLERISMKDRRPHTVRIVYEPPVFAVFLDNMETPILKALLNINGVTDSDGSAYVGFTAATGGGFQHHDILSWRFRALRPRVSSDVSAVSSSITFQKTACLPDRALCTPDQPTVEETSPGVFHVVMPANVEWAVSIPNPEMRKVTLRNVTGTVCWEQPQGNFTGCNGAAGSKAFGSSKRLAVPKQAPGSLVSRTGSGKTEFTVNDRPGAYSDNSGMFEFDVALTSQGNR
ncbi:MAG: hypothetical protein HY820_18205 [Acidobacteria bacterium]|nr:hypothetical protein [Acidobacteriota bacterium]